MTTNKNHNSPNVPNLRFPEFTGEWKKCTIAELATKVGSGVTPRGGEAVYKTEGHPFVRSQNVGLGHLLLDDIAYIDEDTHQRQKNTELQLDDVLLNITGASIGRSAIVTKEIVRGNVNQHVCIIRTKDNLVSSFLCNFLLSNYGQKQIDSFQVGGNRQGLNFEQIKSIKIGLPSIEEQKKIAELLQLLEQRIVTQNKIIEDLKLLKSAIIDYIFNNDVLSVRKRIHLSDVATKVTQKNTNNHVSNVLSNSANQGIIPQSEVFDREIANEDNTSNYFVISQNDFVYNPRKSATAPYGPINRYNGRTDGVISPLYLCFRSHNINVEYLGWYFKSNSWYKYVDQNGDTGVRHDRVSIKDEIFFSMPLFIHNADEQIEIAKRLNKIESFVKQEEQYLFLLESQKLYLLQHLFI